MAAVTVIETSSGLPISARQLLFCGLHRMHEQVDEAVYIDRLYDDHFTFTVVRGGRAEP
jgi:hypothetical protein